MTLTAALDLAWADIRRKHKGVPKAAIAVTPGGSGSRCGSIAWADAPVLLVDTVTLAAEPLDVLAWLIHQAAHGLADTRRKPTSAREGRYHDAAFRDAATELGLSVVKDPASGWSETSMTPELAARYTATADRLTKALKDWEPSMPPARAAQGQRPPGRNQIAARCSCDPPRRIRVTASTLDLGDIRCEICREPFQAG